jgi:hypothetical protein
MGRVRVLSVPPAKRLPGRSRPAARMSNPRDSRAAPRRRVIENKLLLLYRCMTYRRVYCCYRRAEYTEEEEDILRRPSACSHYPPHT